MKHIYLLCTLLLASIYAIAQTYTVQIHVPNNIPLDKLSISYNDGYKETWLQGEEIKNTIVLKGDLHTLFGTLYFATHGEHGMFNTREKFFFGPGNSEIALKDTSLQTTKLTNIVNAKTKGKKEFDLYTDKESKDIRKMILAYNSRTEHPQEFLDSIRNTQIAFDRKALDFIYKNPSTYYSFRQFHDSYVSLQQVVPLDSLIHTFDRFPTSFKNTEEGKKLYKEMVGLNEVRNHHRAADFQTKDIHGNTISLADLKGNFVIIDFWATWCGPCMEVMPKLVDFSNKYPAVKVISISKDRDSTAYTQALKKLPDSWAHIYNDDTIGNTYGVVGIPVLFLIGPDGTVLLEKIGGVRIANYDDVEKAINEVTAKK